MVAQTSSLAAAEDALKAVLLTQQAVPGSALFGVPIEQGNPGAGVKAQHVFIDDDDIEVLQAFDVTIQAGGTGQREETYTIPVVCFAERLGDDWKKARDRTAVLAYEVEKAVVGNYTLNGVVWFASIVSIERGAIILEKRRGAVMVVHVECTQFLT